jgi:hypothetical protein
MVKLLSLFSGIWAFEKALQNLDIPFELVAYCEIDKYASKAYSVLQNAPESMNLGDITKVDGRGYAMPQHREMVLIVSIRKGIDNGIFEFPAPVELTKCMNDYLEETVDEKYFFDT